MIDLEGPIRLIRQMGFLLVYSGVLAAVFLAVSATGTQKAWVTVVFLLFVLVVISIRLLTPHASLMTARKLRNQLAEFSFGCIIIVGLCWILSLWSITQFLLIFVAVTFFLFAYFIIGAPEDRRY